MNRYAGGPRDADDDALDPDVEPDVVPENAPRGGVTVPTPNDTGTTTPPISGWGESVGDAADAEGEERGGT